MPLIGPDETAPVVRPLLEPAEMPAFQGLHVPAQFWWAFPPPAPLAAMEYPRNFDWEQAAALGFERIVCLTSSEASYDASPLILSGFELQDLYGGKIPVDAVAELNAIRSAVDLIAASVNRAEGVLVHCVGGTGRSGTVVGATLVALGEDPVKVATWLQRVHRGRGRHWPESSWQREVLDHFAKKA
jgi:hypothetical protein